MATHDYLIANGTGANVRSDINGALAAIVSNNSSSSEPSTTYAYQWWADTNANVLKIRNSANNAWITLRELDGTILMEDGTAGAPGLAFAADLDTGILRPGDNQINFATAGAERLSIGSTEIVFNEPSNDVDFRVESNGNTHMLFVDGGNDRVGIGFTAEQAPLEVQGENEFASSASTLATAATKSAFRVKGATNSSDSLWMGVETSNAEPYIQGANGVGSASKDLLLNPFGGDVGIGTSSPASRVHVKGGSLTVEHGSPSTGTCQLNINSENFSQATFSYDDEGSVVFGTATTPATQAGFIERMRIGNEGHLFATCNDNSLASLTLKKGSGGDSVDYFQCRDSSNTEKFTIKATGNAENVNGSYGSISDVKLKENIVDASPQWDDIKAVQIRNYNFKEDTGYETHTQIGVIAQEIETVSPGLVGESPDRETVQVPVLDENGEAVLDENGEAVVNTELRDLGTVTKSVKQSVLFMKAVKALQEAMNRIETLEAKVAALEAG